MENVCLELDLGVGHQEPRNSDDMRGSQTPLNGSSGRYSFDK